MTTYTCPEFAATGIASPHAEKAEWAPVAKPTADPKGPDTRGEPGVRMVEDDSPREAPGTASVVPRDPVEEMVASVWADILGMPAGRIGVRVRESIRDLRHPRRVGITLIRHLHRRGGVSCADAR